MSDLQDFEKDKIYVSSMCERPGCGLCGPLVLFTDRFFGRFLSIFLNLFSQIFLSFLHDFFLNPFK